MSEQLTDQTVNILTPDTVNILTLEPNIADLDQVHSVGTAEAARFFRLRHSGLTIEQIASYCKRSRETVHRHLQAFEVDTTEHADTVNKAGALDAALKLRELVQDDDKRISHAAVRTTFEATKLLGQDTKLNIGLNIVLGVSASMSVQVQHAQALTKVTESTLSDSVPNTE